MKITFDTKKKKQEKKRENKSSIDLIKKKNTPVLSCKFLFKKSYPELMDKNHSIKKRGIKSRVSNYQY